MVTNMNLVSKLYSLKPWHSYLPSMPYSRVQFNTRQTIGSPLAVNYPNASDVLPLA